MSTKKKYLSSKYSFLNVTSSLLLHLCLLAFYYFSDLFLKNYYLSLPILFFASSIHQRFSSEWLHEGLHFNIHHNKSLNEFISKWLLASIFFVPLKKMRKAHFSHHSHDSYFNDTDPDTKYALVSSRADLFIALAKDLIGITAFTGYLSVIFVPKQPKSVKESKLKNELLSFIPSVTVHLSLILTTIYMVKFEYLLTYYVSMVTLYPAISRLRLYGQHLYIDDQGNAKLSGSEISRTIFGSFWDRLFISSRLMQYHREHHRIPHLPYRAIEILAKENKTDNPNAYLNSHWLVLKALFRIR